MIDRLGVKDTDGAVRELNDEVGLKGVHPVVVGDAEVDSHKLGAVFPIPLHLLFGIEVAEKAFLEPIIWVTLVILQNVERLIKRFGGQRQNGMGLERIWSGLLDPEIVGVALLPRLGADHRPEVAGGLGKDFGEEVFVIDNDFHDGADLLAAREDVVERAERVHDRGMDRRLRPDVGQTAEVLPDDSVVLGLDVVLGHLYACEVAADARLLVGGGDTNARLCHDDVLYLDLELQPFVLKSVFERPLQCSFVGFGQSKEFHERGHEIGAESRVGGVIVALSRAVERGQLHLTPHLRFGVAVPHLGPLRLDAVRVVGVLLRLEGPDVREDVCVIQKHVAVGFRLGRPEDSADRLGLEGLGFPVPELDEDVRPWAVPPRRDCGLEDEELGDVAVFLDGFLVEVPLVVAPQLKFPIVLGDAPFAEEILDDEFLRLALVDVGNLDQDERIHGYVELRVALDDLLAFLEGQLEHEQLAVLLGQGFIILADAFVDDDVLLDHSLVDDLLRIDFDVDVRVEWGRRHLEDDARDDNGVDEFLDSGLLGGADVGLVDDEDDLGAIPLGLLDNVDEVHPLLVLHEVVGPFAGLPVLLDELLPVDEDDFLVFDELPGAEEIIL